MRWLILITQDVQSTLQMAICPGLALLIGKGTGCAFKAALPERRLQRKR